MCRRQAAPVLPEGSEGNYGDNGDVRCCAADGAVRGEGALVSGAGVPGASITASFAVVFGVLFCFCFFGKA